jgi:cell division septum initiation protein DivIVA
MVAVEGREDIVPLRTDFDRAWRGYDIRQVREYVLGIEAELRLLISDRDAAAANAEDLARQLEEQRTENDRLREKIDRIARTPIEPDGLSERLLRMVELAEDEATEITERARAAAERSWAEADKAGHRLRERHERMVAELDERRRELAAEHDKLMARTRAEIDIMTKQAAQNRRRQEEQAARRREQIENDFAQVMAARRTKALQEIAERERLAKQEAERLVAEATATAQQLVEVAQGKADVMDELRRRTAEALQATHQLLAEAAPLLADPFQVPEQRNESEPESSEKAGDRAAGNGREPTSEPVAG